MNFKKKNYHSLYLTTEEILYKNKYVVKYYEEIKDEIICFLDKDKNIKIFSSICPHFGGEIYYDNKKEYLRCKWHNWKFCKNTGKCLSYPLKLSLNPYDFKFKPDKLKKYNIKSKNGEIFIVYERD